MRHPRIDIVYHELEIDTILLAGWRLHFCSILSFCLWIHIIYYNTIFNSYGRLTQSYSFAWLGEDCASRLLCLFHSASSKERVNVFWKVVSGQSTINQVLWQSRNESTQLIAIQSQNLKLAQILDFNGNVELKVVVGKSQEDQIGHGHYTSRNGSRQLVIGYAERGVDVSSWHCTWQTIGPSETYKHQSIPYSGTGEIE